VQYCAAVLTGETGALTNIFNRYRVRRHDVVYGEADSVGENEAANAIQNAKKFLAKVREKIA